MKVLRCLWKSITLFLIVAIVISGSLLLYLTCTDYNPKPVEPLEIKGNSILKPGKHREFGLLTWNIGYCGMSKEMDFFYDGGKAVRPTLDIYQKSLNGVINFINHSDTLDFILLQEVDLDARRSYYTNQVDLISRNMIDFDYVFALNYNVKFIPFPLLSPLAGIHAGILSFSRFKPSEATRFASPLNFSWPKRIFFLDRCIMKLRFQITNKKSLVVINLHNSAWDEGAELRRHEIDLLRHEILKEYSAGNYVIVGGDWNQNPPGFDKTKIQNGEKVKSLGNPIHSKFLPDGWRWVFDSTRTTNRDANEPYLKGRTLSSTTDFFLISPNVNLKEIKVLDLAYEFSDHQPVYLKISLNEDSTFTNLSNPPQQ